MHRMFSVHISPEKFENATITDHFGIVFEENSDRKFTRLSWRHRFRKAPFSKCFAFTLKRKAGVFKFLRFGKRFRKAPFSRRISLDGRPNCGNKATFSNFSAVVWTGPSTGLLFSINSVMSNCVLRCFTSFVVHLMSHLN